LIAYYPEEVTRNHLLALFDNILWLQEKSQKDSDFRVKFGLYLKVLAYILQNHRNKESTSIASIRKLSNSFLKNISGFLLEKRHTKNELRKVMIRVEVRPSKSLGVPNRKLKKPRVYGIGYRDKGTARKPWLDGTPSWQEVASQPIGALK
jgi:hypothetical protein